MPFPSWPKPLRAPLDEFIAAARREYGALGVERPDLRADLAERILSRLERAEPAAETSALLQLIKQTHGADLCLCLA